MATKLNGIAEADEETEVDITGPQISEGGYNKSSSVHANFQPFVTPETTSDHLNFLEGGFGLRLRLGVF